MLRHAIAFGLAAFASLPAHAQSSGWELHPAESGRNMVLTFGAGQPVSYRFECGAQDVIVTEKGVTELLDLQTGKPVGDDAAGVMTPGASMMALFGGKGQPAFQPAEAVKNPAGGWDLTIHLRKDDRQLKAMAKSDLISLFTTGYTMAVQMDCSSRALWKAFVESCRAP